jgi:trimeric autotransporter adhesin
MKRTSLSFSCLFLLACQIASSQGWNSVGSGVDMAVMALYVDSMGNNLYAGGAIMNAGGQPANKIARWDGMQWQPLGNGLAAATGYPYVYSITGYNGSIIAGGKFDSAGTISANNIARWDGNQWYSMGDGFKNGYVNALAVYNGELYAAGNFDSSGSTLTNNIAKWNGSQWVDVQSGINDGLGITTLCVFDNKLIVGGQFSEAGGIPAYNVAAFDGNSWQALDTGFNRRIWTLRVINGDLFAFGYFTPISSNPARWIARLVNGDWEAFPLPVFGTAVNICVIDMAWYHNEIYIVGVFDFPNNIGRFDGLNYQELDSGLLWQGEVFAVFQNELYVGGALGSASGVPNTLGIARWNDTATAVSNLMHLASVTIYPNPVRDEFSIYGSQFNIIKVELYNIVGEMIFKRECNLNAREEGVDMSPFASGMYFVRVFTEKGAATFKVVKD